jgi:S-methylmethionine-dependent homocysteine/selenocysteine methylase
MSFCEMVQNAPYILAEGAVIERLWRNPAVSLDAHIAHAGLIYEAQARKTLERVYRGYLNVGRDHDLPIIVLTPTWRANPERLSRAGYDPAIDVNGDCAGFLTELVAGYGDYAQKVSIGGLMGCVGDAYRLEETLSQDQAVLFHRSQARALASAGVDFLMGATLPAVSEAVGMAHAMADCGRPYVLSFVVRPTGTLLDGTPLYQALAMIDAQVHPRPLGYMEHQAFVIHKSLRPFLIGRDPLATETLFDQMLRLDRHGRSGMYVTAISSLDCALWDLKGKAWGQPVYRLLGGPTRPAVPAYASMLGFSVAPEAAARVAGAYKDKGFTGQKWFFRYGPGDGERGKEENLTVFPQVDLSASRGSRGAARVAGVGAGSGRRQGGGKGDSDVLIQHCHRW